MSIYKERLFELISKEEVILFAGAGLSLYAGYPSGNALKQIFYNRLTKAEQDQVDKTASLASLTEEIYNLKSSRNYLISILKEIFLNPESSLETHLKIAKIPHFKSIITTNYDCLFEKAFQDKGEVILDSSHIPYIDKNKTQIYKIHGDLSRNEKIILKTSDYNNFFISNSENDLYWTILKEKLATKSVLFIGYSLEDPNVNVLFEKILNVLGDDLKESFFISPSIPEAKKNLLIRKGIHYIESTGEEIFEEIIEYVDNNIINDLEKGNVKAETAKNYTDNFGMRLSIESNVAGFYLKGIEGKDKPVSYKMNFSIKTGSEKVEPLMNFLNGKDIGSFKLDKEDLEVLEIRAESIKIRDISNIQNLYLLSIPDFDGKIDITFDDGFELNDFYVKLYRRDKGDGISEITIDTTNFEIKIKFTWKEKGAKVNFTTDTKDNISDVSSFINYHEGLKRTMDGVGFTIFNNGKKVFAEKYFIQNKNSTIDYFFDFFKMLKRIENHYKVRFKNIPKSAVTDEAHTSVSKLVSKIDGTFLEKSFSGATGILSENIDDGYFSLEHDNDNPPLIICENKQEEVEIFGNTFNLGYKEVHILNPILEKGNEFNYKEGDEVIIKSLVDKIRIHYKDDYSPENRSLL
ncbi:SIR2 family NAD-dependent protein deacylase [Chryseobacterium sp. M5A1_1a]